MRCKSPSGEVELSTPITGIRACCACAASGHAAAAPPSSEMNSAASLDHLVGAQLEFAIDRKAKLLRSLEIDDQLKFAWLLDRQIGRLRALQDLST